MTNAITHLLFLVLLLPACAVAQTPAAAPPVRDVELCDLKLHPKAYDGQFVRVRGNISFGFEDFTFFNPQCTENRFGDSQSTSIWLTYGGDEHEAATYCCGGRSSTPGKDLEINGHKVGLVRDSEYYKLRSRLESERLSYPDGTPCYTGAYECNFYTDVEATITGLFTAKPSEESGYGHFGMYHLLAIQQVSDVAATRSAVPAGGQFRCDRQTWKTECPNLINGKCEVDDPAVFKRIAAHWNDSTELAKGEADSYRSPHDATKKWYSDDLLTAYWIEAGAEQTGARGKIIVTRQLCVPVSDERRPIPDSAEISCRDFSRSWDEDKEASRKWDVAFSEEEKKEHTSWNAPWAIVAETSRKLFPEIESKRNGSSKTVAWDGLNLQLRQWQLTMDKNVQARECQEDPSTTNVLLSDCQWFSADGMKSYSVNLIKYQSEDSKMDISQLPWTVSAVHVRICKVER